jgi:hypothetical protein
MRKMLLLVILLTGCQNSKPTYLSQDVNLVANSQITFSFNSTNKTYDINYFDIYLGYLKWDSTFSTYDNGQIKFRYEEKSIDDYCVFSPTLILNASADYKDIHLYINDVELQASSTKSLIHFTDVNKSFSFNDFVLINPKSVITCRIEGLKPFLINNNNLSAFSFMYVFSDNSTRVQNAGYFTYNSQNISIGDRTENTVKLFIEESGEYADISFIYLNEITLYSHCLISYNNKDIILTHTDKTINLTYYQDFSYLLDFVLPYPFMESWYLTNNTKLILTAYQL